MTSLSPPPLTLYCEGYGDPSFLDGNLLIVSKDSYVFRVHRSVLGASAPVFASGENFDYVEGAETLAVIEVPDGRDDLSLFLRAVYDGIYTSGAWTPDMLKTAYSLAWRYACPMVSDRCRTLLTLAPDDLAQLSQSLWCGPPRARARVHRSDVTFEFRLGGHSTWCHYGVLARRSPVLRSIIEQQFAADIRHENGCVVFEFTAEAEAISDLIQALYHGFYLEEPTKSNMAKYTSLLKLAQQFDIVDLYTEIKSQFRRLYPSSFREVCDLKNVTVAGLLDPPSPLQLLLLAQECDFVEVLHVAHDELSRLAIQDGEIQTEWTSPKKDRIITLAPGYAARFLRGRQAMRGKWDRFIADLCQSVHVTDAPSARGGSGQCVQRMLCGTLLEGAIDETNNFEELTPAARTDWMTLFNMFKAEWEQVSRETPCKACTLWVSTLITNEEQKFWDMVPEVFGLQEVLLGHVRVRDVPMVQVYNHTPVGLH